VVACLEKPDLVNLCTPLRWSGAETLTLALRVCWYMSAWHQLIREIFSPQRQTRDQARSCPLFYFYLLTLKASEHPPKETLLTISYCRMTYYVFTGWHRLSVPVHNDNSLKEIFNMSTGEAEEWTSSPPSNRFTLHATSLVHHKSYLRALHEEGKVQIQSNPFQLHL